MKLRVGVGLRIPPRLLGEGLLVRFPGGYPWDSQAGSRKGRQTIEKSATVHGYSPKHDVISNCATSLRQDVSHGIIHRHEAVCTASAEKPHSISLIQQPQKSAGAFRVEDLTESRLRAAVCIAPSETP
jgi:hypothetical protein